MYENLRRALFREKGVSNGALPTPEVFTVIESKLFALATTLFFEGTIAALADVEDTCSGLAIEPNRIMACSRVNADAER
ncbi:MAG: hypothetical protein H0W86_02580 [Armatimonadetes bacterium]|nr:hypothetical protein [Armatimonadota bacterium]